MKLKREGESIVVTGFLETDCSIQMLIGSFDFDSPVTIRPLNEGEINNSILFYFFFVL